MKQAPFPLSQLFVLLILLRLGAPMESPDGGHPFADQIWDLYYLWSRNEPDLISFMDKCLGPGNDTQHSVFRQSFPPFWPSGDSTVDTFCSDRALVTSRLCSAEEISVYAQFMTLTENPEKMPSTLECMSGKEEEGCWPGFFGANGGEGRPCCDGFFCPRMLTCMIACPLGSHCRKAKVVPGPEKYNVSTEEWCAPYAYKSRFGRCGGADQWTETPVEPFPQDAWAYGRGNIYCPGGSYCPTTTGNPIPCAANSYCRVGSVSATHCPPLVACNGHSLPVSNNKGLVLILIVVFLLAVIWQASKFREQLKRNMGPTEALQIYLQPNTMRIVVPGDRNPTGQFRARAHNYLKLIGTAVNTFFKRFESSCKDDSKELMTSAMLEHDSIDIDKEFQSIDEGSLQSTAWFGNVGTMSLSLDNLELTDLRLTIEFYALNMHLKSCGKCVLASASGVLCKSRLTAIMGPSGAGKTSLLSALAGKAGYGDVSGLILVNGEEESLEKYRRVMGFVPQNDIMHTYLTVEENLRFSARYRLPAGTARHSILSSVERALEILGLAKVRNELIGCETVRGISGGERKRVNIGLEIVADPLILFLDEPTSGLDSSSCKQVVAALQTIAHMGVTTAAIVHQPSHRILCLFDDILLLGNGGTTVYYGPREDTRLYFEGLGFEFPTQANPSDVFMDIVTGQHERNGHPYFVPKDLFDLWQGSDARHSQFSDPELETAYSAQMRNGRLTEAFDIEHCPSLDMGHLGDGYCTAMCTFPVLAVVLIVNGISRCIEAVNASRKALSSSIKQLHKNFMTLGKYTEIESSASGALKRKTPGFLDQFYWCLGRACLQRLRNPLGVFMEISLFSLTGMALGFLADERDTPGLDPIQRDMMHYFIGIGLLSCVSALRTFGLERAVFFRESTCGINRLSFFMANDVYGMARCLIYSLCFSSLYATFAQLQGAYYRMYMVVVSLMYAWTGVGYCLSQAMSYTSAQLASAVLVLFDTLVSNPTFGSGPLTKAIRLASFSRWAMQCVIIIEALHLKGVWLLQRCLLLNSLDFPISSFMSSLFAILALGLFARIVACVMLFNVDKDKQQ